MNFTKEDIKRALFSIPNDKSPGIDGYNSFFFKTNWDILGDEVSDAILDFFKTGKLIKELNVTSITLIPKSDCPKGVSDYRPIACSGVIYKCITKLIAFQLNKVLPNIISCNQGAFVSGRSILQNILVCQDIVKIYRKGQLQKCCMMKLDLRKAYDTLEWGFIEEMLYGLNFPEHLTKLIMTCITSPTFTLLINGGTVGFFKSKRGIRQGDPMSPLIFVIAMEYLSRIMKVVGQEEHFHFHSRCRLMQLNQLCFADDLLLFCKGEMDSIKLLLNGFNVFSDTSGLQVNKSKSSVYCCSIDEETQNQIQQVSGFTIGSLPFRYLGVPISTTKLKSRDCEILLEKMTARIKSWSTRHLSFAARCQLINSVLMSIQVYWGQIFLFPK